MLSDERRSTVGDRFGSLWRSGLSRYHKRLRLIGHTSHQTGKTHTFVVLNYVKNLHKISIKIN